MYLFSVSGYKNRDTALPVNTVIHTGFNIQSVEFSRGGGGRGGYKMQNFTAVMGKFNP